MHVQCARFAYDMHTNMLVNARICSSSMTKYDPALMPSSCVDFLLIYTMAMPTVCAHVLLMLGLVFDLRCGSLAVENNHTLVVRLRDIIDYRQTVKYCFDLFRLQSVRKHLFQFNRISLAR